MTTEGPDRAWAFRGERKRRAVRFVQRYLANPPFKVLVRLGMVPTHALLETRGRKSSRPRVVPVGNRLQGDTFWVVAEHGKRAGWVRNVDTNPRVRVKMRGRWRTGTAHLMPDDDPIERLRSTGRRGTTVRLMGTDLLTVRIDLDR